MRLLIDEDVPRSVADVFEQRGHEILYVRDVLGEGTPDPAIANHAHTIEATIVTWNHRHFRRWVSHATRAQRRRAGRISFRCKETDGPERARLCMDLIEAEYDLAQRRPNKAVLMEVRADGIFIVI